jgi:hypothetical protein
MKNIKEIFRSFLIYSLINYVLGSLEYVLVEGKSISDINSLFKAFINPNVFYVILIVWFFDIYSILKSYQNLN